VIQAPTLTYNALYQDNEALLSPVAARQYEGLWYGIARIYADELANFHPEHLLAHQMTRGGITRDFLTTRGVRIYQCNHTRAPTQACHTYLS
jgi:hypothetical protein